MKDRSSVRFVWERNQSDPKKDINGSRNFLADVAFCDRAEKLIHNFGGFFF